MATIDEQKKYTPINATSAAGINWDNYQAELAKQMQYNAANPTATQAYTKDEKQALYGSITDPIWNTGVYTKDKEGAYAAGAQWGIQVTPTEYGGESGYYYVPDVKDQRTIQQGASGADEGLMNNQDYAIVQSLKNDFADAQSGYNAAIAAGDADLAAKYQQAMNNAHLEAERIRAGYGYSGGQDGSMYITHGALGVNSGSNGSGGGDGISGSSGGGISSGGSGSGSGTVTDLSEWIEAMYNAKTEADMAALEAAFKQNMASLDRAEVGVKEAYQDNRNQTAGASELAARNFAEYANAYGMNSGTGGQAELARNVTLQNNMNDINMQESQTLADLDLARSNAETEYNLAIAQAEATGDYELAAALYQEKVRVQEALTQLMMWETEVSLQQQQMETANNQWQQQFAFQQQQYNDSLAQNQQSALAEYGNAYLQNGIMPSAEMLAAMGITQADAQAYISAIQAQAGTSGSGSGSGAKSSTMTLTTAKQAANAGVFTDDVLSVLRANGYTDEMITGIYGWDGGTPDSANGGSVSSEYFFSPVIESLAIPEKSLAYLQDTVGSNGYGASFNTAWSQARKKFDSGASEQEIMNYLDTFSELRLTDAGLSYIMNSLNLGGYRG